MTLSPKAWGDVLRRLQHEIPDFAFDAWIAPMTVRMVFDNVETETAAETATETAVRADGSVESSPSRPISHHVILGCPTSFHRDHVRTNFGEIIRSCWRSACDVFAVESAGDEEHATTLEFLTMKEFAEAPGTRIEVRLPERQETALRSPMRKVAAGQVAFQAAQGMGAFAGPASNARVVRSPSISSAPRPAPPMTQPSSGPVSSGLRAVPDPRHGKQARGPSWRIESRAGNVESAAKENAERRDHPSAAIQPELPFSFESFVVGPCNALAREAALALARRRQRSLNQLYLGGGSGMGKTHLARATAAEARRQGPHFDRAAGFAGTDSSRVLSPSARREQAPRVIYTSAEQFTSEFVSAMRRGQPEEWKRRYRGAIGMLIVEDVQFFSGRAKTQLELFHTVSHVLDGGGSVLLTGDRAPRDLVGLDERVRAQLGRGFVAELEMPDALVRRHILRSKASGGGVHLPEDCLDLLVESTAGSVREIESMLIQVVTTSSLLGRKIDLELVREAVTVKSGDSGVLDAKGLATEEIVRIVASFFSKRPEALAGRSRRRDVLIPRQLAMYLAHRYTDASFTEIGRCLGRDHPSVRNAIGRVERLVLENAPLRYQVEALSERIDRALQEKEAK